MKDMKGNYDEYAKQVMITTKAVGVILIVINGEKGTGFSLATIDPTLVPMVPDLLVQTAAQIQLELPNMKVEIVKISKEKGDV